MYPLTIGANHLIASILKKININVKLLKLNSNLEVIRLIKSNPQECCRIIAYRLVKGNECLDNEKIEDIMDALSTADVEDLAVLLILSLEESKVAEIQKYLGITEELDEYQRVICMKDRGSVLSFGGKSIYGSLIDVLAEKYGWTLDYIIWGISYDNIRLLMSDTTRTIMLSEEEQKRIHTKKGKDVIRVDDPKNIDILKAMNFD